LRRIKRDDGESRVSIEARVLPRTQADDAGEDSDASDAPAEIEAASNDAGGKADNAVTSSENDDDPHNLDDQDPNAVDFGGEVEVEGRAWGRVEGTNDGCSKWLKDNPRPHARHRALNRARRSFGFSPKPKHTRFWLLKLGVGVGGTRRGCLASPRAPHGARPPCFVPGVF
jgi:hypothetical protein